MLPTHPSKTTHTLWFVLRQDEILIVNSASSKSLPDHFDIDSGNEHILRHHHFGLYNNKMCCAVEVDEKYITPPTMAFFPLRQFFEYVQNEDWQYLASRAKQILLWDKNTQFCGQCGGKTVLSLIEKAKNCQTCQVVFYPQIAPVVLVVIYRHGELLLARSPHFPTGVYSALAGFVETGETVEQALRREVMEEVALSVKNIRYFGSQPWPFPSNLMLGFTAEYDHGEIRIDPTEIEDAQWFSIDHLPKLPSQTQISLSYQLIMASVAALGKSAT